LLVALCGIAAAQWLWPSSPAPAANAAVPEWGPQDYDAALAELNRAIARGREGVAADPQAWLPRESLAMALRSRGQLTGSHADLVEALDMADSARDSAPDGSGPVLARAIVSLSLHRNSAAEQEVARMDGFAIAPPPGDRAESEAIRGDVALYRGDYRAALERYRTADSMARGLGTIVRLADWHRHRGDFAAARALLEQGLASPRKPAPWAHAALLLQMGALDLQAGDWTAAEARFAKADSVFPGWWLAQAHRAQMAAVRGDYARAEGLYRKAMEGAERPSVMEALAGMLSQAGRPRDGLALEHAARALWQARVATHPEAYADHAFEAALREGDSAAAWRLARLNYRARPYGDARIGLARAAAARGRDASARAILEELHRTGWRSSEQYRVLAEVCGRLGDSGCQGDARRKALAISPRALDPRAALLHFGNH
jgi:tetratricopeptide (TPR) repeat protein